VAVYIHHSKKGPDFVWDQGRIAGLLAEVRYRQGRLLGRVEGLGVQLRAEAREQVRLLDLRAFDGAGGERFAGMVMDAAEHYSSPLMREGLSHWHKELYPATEKTASRAKVHFQSAAGEGSEGKLSKLIHWVNSEVDTDPVVKAAVAQLWLVALGPFETGNERLGELVMELLMARANQSGERLYSVAGQMRTETREYKEILSGMLETQGDATSWIEWFLGCLGRAIASSNEALGLILKKNRLLERCAGMALNERQRMMLERLLYGQEGKLTSSRWAFWTKTSQDTAGRDINDLVRRGLLTKEAGRGRSTSYVINPNG
jgi:Fic family protein